MGAKECAEHLATKGFDIGAMPARRFPPPWSVEETDACFIVRDPTGRRSPTSISRRNQDDVRRRIRITTTTRGTANQLPSWGISSGTAEYLLFKTRFGTVGEPNEVICQSQQDRFCLGVRSLAIVHASAARSRQ